MKFVERQWILYFFIIRVTLNNIANIPLDRTAALVLSVINWTYCRCTGIRQICLEIWPEPDLTGFQKNGQILGMRQPEPKSGTSQHNIEYDCMVAACCPQSGGTLSLFSALMLLVSSASSLLKCTATITTQKFTFGDWSNVDWIKKMCQFNKNQSVCRPMCNCVCGVVV